MMELGNLAAQDGWLVFEVLRNANPETIDRTTRSFSSPGVLFLFDYLENCPAFRDMSLHIAQLAGSGVNVRFVASARESFVRSDLIVDDSMLILPHSPQGVANSAWWDSYRLATFRHITGHLGVEMQSDSPSDIPVIAVLELELQRANNSQNDDESAKTWTGRRLDILLQGEKVSKKSLAILAAQCPLDDEAYARLCGEPRDAFVALWNSGWIEDRETEAGHRYYRIVHDYLADQIVLHWLETESPRGLGKVIEIRELLKLAYTLGSLGSAIAALQRIIEKISGFGVADFSDLIESEIAANNMIWAMHRQDVLYTNLLPPIAKVHLLHRLGGYWQGAENENWFQLEIAVLAKSLAVTKPPADEFLPEVRERFESLIASLASGADERNMLVTYGLRLLPNSKHMQQIALDWLGKYANRFGATYVIRAWLDMRLPSREVEPAIRVWLSRFGNSINAQFVLAAWLRGAGVDGVTRFESETLEWFERHGTETVAQHVYSAWLKAGGKPQSISDYVGAWLARNWALEEDPSFLLRRWLRASGPASLILPHARKWIDRYGSADSASFVYSAAVDFVELSPLVREPMLMWISTRSTSPLARPCIVAWLRARCDRSLMAKYVREWLSANDTMEEAGEVITKWLEAEGKLEMVLPHAITWIGSYGHSQYANFVLKSLLENAKSSDEIRDLALRWLELNCHRLEAEQVLSAWIRGSYSISIIQQFVLEWCRLFPTETCARYLYEQWLLAGGSHEALFDNIMAWLAEHGLELDAGRALAALLRAGVPWKRYVEHLKQWTACYKCDREATFFYSAWLADSERNPSLIDNAIRAWLENHAEWKDADFLLNAWLKRENAPTGTVRAGYDRYMAVHGKSFQAQTVRKNWEIAVELERKARIDKLR